MKGSIGVIGIFIVLILVVVGLFFVVKRMKDASANVTLNAS